MRPSASTSTLDRDGDRDFMGVGAGTRVKRRQQDRSSGDRFRRRGAAPRRRTRRAQRGRRRPEGRRGRRREGRVRRRALRPDQDPRSHCCADEASTGFEVKVEEHGLSVDATLGAGADGRRQAHDRPGHRCDDLRVVRPTRPARQSSIRACSREHTGAGLHDPQRDRRHHRCRTWGRRRKGGGSTQGVYGQTTTPDHTVRDEGHDRPGRQVRRPRCFVSTRRSAPRQTADGKPTTGLTTGVTTSVSYDDKTGQAKARSGRVSRSTRGRATRPATRPASPPVCRRRRRRKKAGIDMGVYGQTTTPDHTVRDEAAAGVEVKYDEHGARLDMSLRPRRQTTDGVVANRRAHRHDGGRDGTTRRPARVNVNAGVFRGSHGEQHTGGPQRGRRDRRKST